MRGLVGRPHGLLGATIEAISLWVSWVLLQLGYVYIRAVGDDLWTPHDIRGFEEGLFFGSPAHAWQEFMPPADYGWLAEAAYLFHGFWFGIPFAFGLIVMRYDRDRLFAFVVWTTVVSYACAIVFALAPVRPPWADGDIVRVLVESGVTDYTGLDNNPFAAFPSMHAALPMAITLFLFFGSPRTPRLFAWLLLAYTVGVGASVVYLGEHWLLDVVAGYAFAGATAVALTRTRTRRWIDKPFWKRPPAPLQESRQELPRAA